MSPIQLLHTLTIRVCGAHARGEAQMSEMWSWRINNGACPRVRLGGENVSMLPVSICTIYNLRIEIDSFPRANNIML